MCTPLWRMEDLFNVTGYRPQVSIEQGVQAFVDWYRSYYHQ